MDYTNILRIECTSMNPDSEHLAEWSIKYNQRQASGILPRLITPQQQQLLKWYLEDYIKWPFMEFRRRANDAEYELIVVGKALFQAIFASSVESVIIYQEWSSIDQGHSCIQLESDNPFVLSLPWELLHDGFGMLALRRHMPIAIIRVAKAVPARLQTNQIPVPLRVLMIVARPENSGFLDPRSSAQAIFQQIDTLIQEHRMKPGMIEFEFLRPPTYQNLAIRLQDRTRPVHILHFDGHGMFAPTSDPLAFQRADEPFKRLRVPQGMLAFEDAANQLDLVKAAEFAELLNGAEVRLVLLDACQTAVMDTQTSYDSLYQREQALGSVATQLLTAGVPAVVAMSASVLVSTTALFFGELYAQMLTGAAIPIAVERARQRLHSQPVRLTISQRKGEESESIKLMDWWLPHFYQQQALSMNPTGKPKTPHTPRLTNFPDYLQRPAFVGRARELLIIERALLLKKIMILHGFGGIGKTYLASEAARWLTKTQMYKDAICISFEQGGGYQYILSTIARHYEIAEFDSHDCEAALKRLIPLMLKTPCVLILDNLETMFPQGHIQSSYELDDSDRSQVWDTLFAFREVGIGIIITSRDADMRDIRVHQNNSVLYEVKGFIASDAHLYTMALMNSMGIGVHRVPKADLETLLNRLDYHPLAINLMLLALRDSMVTTSEILKDYTSLLSQFQDANQPMRNVSLEASIEYALRYWGEELRMLLQKLSVFEYGANEQDIKGITEIPSSQWSLLRDRLIHSGLISVQQLAGVSSLFLKFHPILIPYLRASNYILDRNLERRFAEFYLTLLIDLHSHDETHPGYTRPVFAKLSPNFEKALSIFEQYEDIEIYIEMSGMMYYLYDVMGMYRERKYISRKIENMKNKQISILYNMKRCIIEGDELFIDNKFNEAKDIYLKGINEVNNSGLILSNIDVINSYYRLKLGLIRCLRVIGYDVDIDIKNEINMTIEGYSRVYDKNKDNKDIINLYSSILFEIGDFLTDNGDFYESRDYFKTIIAINKVASKSIYAIERLGYLDFMEKKYDDAYSLYVEVGTLAELLGIPELMATSYHQIGLIFQEKKDYINAENCYRESLIIRENLRDASGIAQTCNQLMVIAMLRREFDHAEQWCKRVLSVATISVFDRAVYLTNMAAILVQRDDPSLEQLQDARRYAEESLSIKRSLSQSNTEIAITMQILAKIETVEARIQS